MMNIIRQQNVSMENNKNTIDSLEQFISDAHLDKEKIQEQLEQFIYQADQNKIQEMMKKKEDEFVKK